MKVLGIGLLALTLLACGGSDSEESGAVSPAPAQSVNDGTQAWTGMETVQTADAEVTSEDALSTDAQSTVETDAATAGADATTADEETATGSDDAVAVEDGGAPEEEDASGDVDVAVVVPDTTEVEEEKDLSELDLNGTIPVAALAPPTFLAENYDGGTRTEADLIGKPTVMWFFPFAGTPG